MNAKMRGVRDGANLFRNTVVEHIPDGFQEMVWS
jgi:hypothetical protein